MNLLRARCACLGLAEGCSRSLVGVAASAAFTALEDRRTTGTQIDDEGIELRAIEPHQRALRRRAHVNVTSYNRIVLLTGEAPDEATQRRDREDRARRAERARRDQRAAGRRPSSAIGACATTPVHHRAR